MRKTQEEKWKDAISAMEPNTQIEIAELLLEELSRNEEYLEPEDKYKISKSQKVREILEKYIARAEDISAMKDLRQGLEQLSKLSIEKQLKAIIMFSDEILALVKEDEEQRMMAYCKKNGHGFEDWETEKFLDLENIDDKEYVSEEQYKHRKNGDSNGSYIQEYIVGLTGKRSYHLYVTTNEKGQIYWLPYSTKWVRKCSRCNYIEQSKIEPKEVKKARLEKEREEQINSLENQLKQLKKKKNS